MNKKLKKCINGYGNWHTSRQMANTNDNDQKQTEVIVEVEFEIPNSHIGKLFEGYEHSRLQKIIERQLQDSQ
jgi:hypothetical protein